MKFVLKRKKYFSPSGFLAELVSSRYKDTPFKIHSYFVKINSGCTRARHYHKKEKEWATAVWGKVLLKMENIKTKQRKEYLLDAKAKTHKIVCVPPYWAHSVKAVAGDATLVVFTLKPKNKAEAIPYEI